MKNNQYLFSNPLTLANHVIYKLERQSAAQIQKTLYFLFAFYGASYGKSEHYPKYLFEESFEAWKFGPVLRSVYFNQLNDQLKPVKWIPASESEEAVSNFMDDIIDAVKDKNDFQLIERSLEDQAWIDAYVDSIDEPIGIMDSEQIIEPYIKSVAINK